MVTLFCLGASQADIFAVVESIREKVGRAFSGYSQTVKSLVPYPWKCEKADP